MATVEQQRKRLQALEQATMKWSDAFQIESIYLHCDLLNLFTKKRYNVDHIIPLHHHLVCGLHNEFNLQIMEAKDNNAKGNSFRINQPHQYPFLPNIDGHLEWFNRVLYYFSDIDNCIKFIESVRWQKGISCVFCKHSKVYICKGKKYRCASCRRDFKVQTKTFLAKSTISLDKCLCCLWVLAYRHNTSVNALGRMFGVTRLTALKLKQVFRQKK